MSKNTKNSAGIKDEQKLGQIRQLQKVTLRVTQARLVSSVLWSTSRLTVAATS